MIRAERGMRGDNNSDRTVHSRKLLDRGDVLHVSHAGTTVLRRKDDAHQSHLPQFLDRRERELTRLVPLHHIGLDFALGKLTNALFQLQLLFVQLEIQDSSGPLGRCDPHSPAKRALRTLRIRLKHSAGVGRSYHRRRKEKVEHNRMNTGDSGYFCVPPNRPDGLAIWNSNALLKPAHRSVAIIRRTSTLGLAGDFERNEKPLKHFVREQPSPRGEPDHIAKLLQKSILG